MLSLDNPLWSFYKLVFWQQKKPQLNYLLVTVSALHSEIFYSQEMFLIKKFKRKCNELEKQY